MLFYNNFFLYLNCNFILNKNKNNLNLNKD